LLARRYVAGAHLKLVVLKHVEETLRRQNVGLTKEQKQQLIVKLLNRNCGLRFLSFIRG
jgi:hypothetical protein